MASTSASQSPLRVFVSSRMSPEMRLHREVASRVLRSSLTQVWLFEDTPASPDAPDVAYLDAISRADIFIWLLADTTSEAVELEVRSALRLPLPMLVFRFPAAHRDERSMRLMADVGSAAKYKDIQDPSGFDEELSLALNDVLIQGVRDRQRSRSASALERLKTHLESIAIGRWRATGVSLEKASDLLSDVAVGSASLDQLPSDDSRIVVLTGEVGSGKSLAALRHALAALALRAGDPGAPVPAWVNTDKLESVDDALRRSVEIDEPLRVGACIVIDGVDEHGTEAQRWYLEQALGAAASHRSTRVLLTARSGRFAERAGVPSKRAPRLAFPSALELMNRCFDLTLAPRDGHAWPPVVRDAVERPLFALLLGRYLAGGGSMRGSTPAGLIDALVVDEISRSGAGEAAFERLALLAVRSIDADGRPVPLADIGNWREREELLSSRLISATADGVEFGLPLLREWFGGRAIEAGLVQSSHVARDEAQLERWRYSAGIAAAIAPRAVTDRLLRALATTSPGFASEVVDASATEWTPLDHAVSLPAKAIETSYRSAYEALLQGLAGDRQEHLLPAGARSVDELSMGVGRGTLYVGLHETRSAIDLSAQFPIDVPGRWLFISSRRASRDATWPWRTARDDIKTTIAALMKPFRLIVPPMFPEMAWAAAVELTGGRSHLYEPLRRSVVEGKLEEHGHDELLMMKTGLVLPLEPVRSWLRDESRDWLECPYPNRDGPLGGWAHSGFSAEVLLARARLVHQAALLIYAEVVDTFFPGLAERLEWYAMRPLRLVGRLVPSRTPHAGTTLSYYPMPLPTGSIDEVDLENGSEEFGWDDLGGIASAIASRRPTRPWLRASVTGAGVDVYGATPASDLAFERLRSDMRSLGWQ